MSRRFVLVTTALALGLTTGCGLFRTEYPPAYPHPAGTRRSRSCSRKPPRAKDFCPQPVRRVANPLGIPSAEEWKGQWKLKPVAQKVCRGTGKQRRCRTEPTTAVDTANQQSVLRATPWNMKQGRSGHVRWPFESRQGQVYEVVTSPREFTYLAFLEGERQAGKLMLEPYYWEVVDGKSGEEGSYQEVVMVRPIVRPEQPLPLADAGRCSLSERQEKVATV